ncbi:MAG: hypothetical protein M3P37_11120 [Actinomycetota bacterium]|jgi:anti-anti-sigma regulatory factor|nr:hypothetical protein [Actinomycetota bacterium]
MGEIKQHSMILRDNLVELSGEFDARDLKYLREILNEAGERSAVVDLSGITFLDVQTTRELAIRHQLYAGSLAYRRPSWAVRASVTACGYENWFRFDAEEAGDGLVAGLRDRC